MRARPETIEGYEEELDAAASMVDRLLDAHGDMLDALKEARSWLEHERGGAVGRASLYAVIGHAIAKAESEPRDVQLAKRAKAASDMLVALKAIVARYDEVSAKMESEETSSWSE